MERNDNDKKKEEKEENRPRSGALSLPSSDPSTTSRDRSNAFGGSTPNSTPQSHNTLFETPFSEPEATFTEDDLPLPTNFSAYLTTYTTNVPLWEAMTAVAKTNYAEENLAFIEKTINLLKKPSTEYNIKEFFRALGPNIEGTYNISSGLSKKLVRYYESLVGSDNSNQDPTQDNITYRTHDLRALLKDAIIEILAALNPLLRKPDNLEIIKKHLASDKNSPKPNRS